MRPTEWGLRARLVALVFLALAPALGLLAYAALSRRSSALEAVRLQALQAAKTVADRQQKAFEDTGLILRILGGSPVLTKGTTGECEALLGDVLRQQPVFANLGIARQDGTFRASVLPIPAGATARDRSWFRRALATGGFAVGDYQIGRITGRASINAAIPIDGANGGAEALFAALDLTRLQEEASRIVRPEGATLTLLDRGGTILLNLPVDPDLVGKTVAADSVTAETLSGSAGATAGEDERGVRRLFGYAPLRSNGPESVAFVRIGIPEEHAVAAANRELGWILLLAAILVSLALAAAYGFGHLLVVRHARRLERVAGRLRDGDLGARSGPAYGAGEIGRLERAFDEMADGMEKERAGREAARASLREREDMFSRMAGSVEQAFWVTEPGEKPFRYVSPAFERIWGFPPDRLYADPSLWKDSIHPSDRQRVLEAITRQEQNGRYEETYRIVRPDGSTRWVRDRAFPEKDAGGGILRIYGVAEDITESREMQHRFQQVQKMEAVGRLAAGVAHDFNNLLTVITGYTQLVAQTVEPAEREHLEEVLKASKHAAALTRQLLAFSRKQVMAPVPLDLNTLLSDMGGMIGRLVGPTIEVVSVPGRDLGKVHADPNQIHQVVMNLVVNARDAMPAGGRLTLETYNVDVDEQYSNAHLQSRPGPYVVLAVTDTGVGMDEATRQKVFEPFFTTKEEGKGTGLGLATVFGIVKQSSGEIFVYSEKGMGTTFKMYFPRLTGTVPAPSRMDGESARPANPCTVLLVEDDPAIRALIYGLLRAEGHTVIAAAGPEEALRELDGYGEGMDLLLTDLALPGMDGLALAEKVRSMRPGVKVLLVSGYAESMAARTRALPPGTAFLPKPFGPPDLLRKMAELLAGEVPQP